MHLLETVVLILNSTDRVSISTSKVLFRYFSESSSSNEDGAQYGAQYGAQQGVRTASLSPPPAKILQTVAPHFHLFCRVHLKQTTVRILAAAEAFCFFEMLN